MSLRERVLTFADETSTITDAPTLISWQDESGPTYQFRPDVHDFLVAVRHIADKSTKLNRFQAIFTDVKLIEDVEEFYANDAKKMLYGTFQRAAVIGDTIGIFIGENRFWNIPLSAVEVVE